MYPIRKIKKVPKKKKKGYIVGITFVVSLSVFSLADFSTWFFILFSSMARRSPRKKTITPETIVDSEEEEFIAVASDDQ